MILVIGTPQQGSLSFGNPYGACQERMPWITCAPLILGAVSDIFIFVPMLVAARLSVTRSISYVVPKLELVVASAQRALERFC